jgi:hypothetical protein
VYFDDYRAACRDPVRSPLGHWDVFGVEQLIEATAIETYELTTKRKEESRPPLAPIVSMFLTGAK